MQDVLHLACSNGHVEVARISIHGGISIDQRDYGMPILYIVHNILKCVHVRMRYKWFSKHCLLYVLNTVDPTGQVI